MATKAKFDWQAVLRVKNPGGEEGWSKGRPRRLSIHTIATVVGRDALEVLEEMKASELVEGYICPDVNTPIFFLKEMSGAPGMITGGTDKAKVWERAKEWLEKYPLSKVKGFKRDPVDGYCYAAVDGNYYPLSKFGGKTGLKIDYSKPMKTNEEAFLMDVPFEKDDAEYEAAVKAALEVYHAS